jgi:pteridine reductase
MEDHTLNQNNTQVSRVAIVTGGACRIGAVIVRRLHGAGFNVIIHYHKSHREAQELAQQLNRERENSALTLRFDLSKQSCAIECIEQSIQWLGRLDLLVNNASVFIRTPIQENHEKAFELMWTTNVNAPFWLSEAAYSSLVKNKGAIINLTDIHAERPLRDYGAYCQTKAALKMQTEVLAKEYAPKVRVNAVAPGAIVWPVGDNALTASQKNVILSKTPLQCHGNPLWIAEAVLALVENEFITGQTLRVDGGRSLG